MDVARRLERLSRQPIGSARVIVQLGEMEYRQNPGRANGSIDTAFLLRLAEWKRAAAAERAKEQKLVDRCTATLKSVTATHPCQKLTDDEFWPFFAKRFRPLWSTGCPDMKKLIKALAEPKE